MPDDLPRFDTNTPSVARIYDAMLGGRDNYEVDRQVYRQTVEIEPNIATYAVELRRWLVRAVRFLAEGAGIDQFLDCGSGLPTAENTHQVVQRINPEARVLYVDHDPMVVAHARAILDENDHTEVLEADLRYPAELLSHPLVTSHLDLTRPIALIQNATLHHVRDEDDPWQIMAGYLDGLMPGSYVAISHFLDPEDGGRQSEVTKALRARYRAAVGSGTPRNRARITAFFDGLELVEPGLVRFVDWWPDGPHLAPLPDILDLGLAGVGRKA
jgi:trans-aconitate methyltransferase